MLILRVAAFHGVAPSTEHSVSFGEAGGSIGRSPDNTLVLDDTERQVSRLHARIVCTNRVYSIVDQGSNPLWVNGRALGQGMAASLSDGDELRIGEYSLQVKLAVVASASVTPAAPSTDPLSMFASQLAVCDDPFANLLAPQRSVASVFPGSTPPQARLPEDFDPFAVPLQPATPASLREDFDLGNLAATPSGGSQIDALFGLGPRSTDDPFADLLPPYAPDAKQPSDPLEAFGAPAQAIPEASQPDHVQEWRAAFTPPRMRESPPLAGNEGAVLDDPLALFGAATPPRPYPRSPVSESPLADIAAPLDAPSAVATSGRVPERKESMLAGTSAAMEATLTGASGDDLLAALFAGLGEPNLRIPGGFTPELARQLGELLSEATRGTLDLLVARALTKREVRAEVTMIVAKENNPLKFSPNPAVALQHLLAPQGQGFLGPTAALRDAYDDLRAHQFGFTAGMRAALAGVLARFEPTRLEARLADKSLLDSVLPANRKAKLWDQFQALYGDISREAEDDFHSLFGREFLRAYEEQIDRLDRERKGRS